MEWSKLKTIIILILLLLNGFLFTLLWGREAQAARSLETARREAIAVLRESGVALEDDTVPQDTSLPPMAVARDLEAEETLAARLLGGSVTAEARGGQVYRYYNAAGSVQFHSGGVFLAQLTPGAFPLEGREAEEHGAWVLEQLGFSGRAVETTFAEGEGSITFLQELDGVPLLDCQATLHYEGGELVSITDGRRLSGTPYATGRETITAATALMHISTGLKELGDIYSQIESIVPAYTMTTSLTGPASLTPVWFVRTDTGTYQLDTVTGALTRSNGRV